MPFKVVKLLLRAQLKCTTVLVLKTFQTFQISNFKFQISIFYLGQVDKSIVANPLCCIS